MSDQNVTEADCVVERVMDAPAELVWKMWTEPEHFKQWYGPQGATVPVAEIDARVGGKHLFCMQMQTPNGEMQMWSTGEFTEMVPYTRLVYTDSMADENGNVVSPQAMGMPEGYPETTVVTITLEALGNGQTKMVLTHTGVPAQAAGGWSQAFEKMANLLPNVSS